MVSVEVLPDMSPGNKILLVTAVAVLTASIGIFVFRNYVATGGNEGLKQTPVINEKQAVEFALETTEVKAENATISKRELIYKKGKPQYKIQFSTLEKNDNVQFICTIDGMTGDVINVRKTVSSRASSENDGASDTDAYDDPDQFIGVDQVMEIVLSDTGLDRSETEFKAVRLNNRNNIMVYVAEFESGEVDYKFFVDAVTGAVIERRVEYDDE